MPVDEFTYGRRQVVTYDHTGQPHYQYRPLAPEDFLDPQEGDAFSHGQRHDQVVQALTRALRWHYRFHPSAIVLQGVKIRWADRSLPGPAPDLAVVLKGSEPRRPRTLFDVQQEGAHPCFILEVTSPLLAHLDREAKREIYARAGVEEYFLVDWDDPGPEGAMPRLVGYRLADGTYASLAPDVQGRLVSQELHLALQVQPGGAGVAWVDLRTDRPIMPEPGWTDSPAEAQAEAHARARSIADSLSSFLSGEDHA